MAHPTVFGGIRSTIVLRPAASAALVLTPEARAASRFGLVLAPQPSKTAATG